jgi:Na+-driven multidrug efflux pump
VLAVFVGLTLSRLTFTIFQTDRLVAQVGTQYLELCAFGNLPFIVSCCLGAIFRSFAAPKYCLYLWLLTAGISIAGSFLLAAAPRQWCGNSVAALAIAWDIGCLVGTSAGLIWLRRLFRTLPLTGDSAKPVDLEALAGSGSIQRLLDIATVSVPAVVADSCWILANFLVFRILSVLPDATRAQAAWSIALKLEETFALMPLVALNLAAAVIVGQSLGAGNPLRARLATWQMAGTGALAMFILGGAIAVAAPALASLMSMDAGIGSWTIILLRGAPALLPLAAVWLIVLGGLEGAGDTRVSMLCNLLGLLCVQLPITWLFVIVFGWGATGICASLGAARLFLSGAALWGFCHVSPASGGVPQKISA